MTLTITDTLITSDLTDHQAAKVTRSGTWCCTWLPGRELDCNAAVTAMSIAEEIAKGRDDDLTANALRKRRQLIVGWCEELGIYPVKAMAMLKQCEGTARSAPEDNTKEQ